MAATPCDLDSLSWMLGNWVTPEGKSATHESWVQHSADTWEGVGYSEDRSSGERTQGESLRLVSMGGEIFYIAKVAHNDYPTAFKLVECGPDRALFTNPEHDFPKALEYRLLEGGHLDVLVSDGAEKGFRLGFVRQP
ncbi:MAG: hypothetical protein H6678_03125 [Candidatus Delongbacteria bacterium]|nr:hypothetical protein [Candidatus Delongbacteria bacterium]